MALRVFELISIVLCAMVGGMFWGPWLALSRSIDTFEPEVFLAITHRMIRNMSSLMTGLMPLGLLSMGPVLMVSYGRRPVLFSLTLGALAAFVVVMLVTVLIEVPIVKQIASWTISTLPGDWRERRDRWARFHVVRVVAAVVGLGLLVGGALIF